MNGKMIGKLLGFLLLLECLFLFPPALISILDREQTALRAIFTTMALSAGAGTLLWSLCRKAQGRFYAREGFLITGLGREAASGELARLRELTKTAEDIIGGETEWKSGTVTSGPCWQPSPTG